MTRIRDDRSSTNRRFQGGRRHRSVVAVVVLIVAAIVLWGCPEEIDEEDLEAERPDEEEEVQVDVDIVDGFDDDEGYSRPDYTGQRSPFRPDVEVLGLDEDDDDVDEARPMEPLEQHSLDELDLVTIISQTAVPRAMFVDPEGMGHFAMEGDRIGDAGGIVRDIRPDEVEVREGDNGASVTVQLRERDIETPTDDELTEEERRMLEELLGTEEGREALGEEFADTDDDERFPGLTPPE